MSNNSLPIPSLHLNKKDRKVFLEKLFNDVQGNILNGFSKPNLRLIFFKFGDADTAINWLSGMADTVASAAKLKRASEERRKQEKNHPTYQSQEIWLHVSLSKTGIEKLRIGERYLPIPLSAGIYEGARKESKIKKSGRYEGDSSSGYYYDPFRDGMKSRPTSLGDIGDSKPDRWEEPYKNSLIDALFIAAADQEDDLDSYTVRLIEDAGRRGILCVGIEIGRALLNEQGKQVEHFGFRDGVSQPLIIGIDDEKIKDRANYKDAFYPEDFLLVGLKGKLRWANNGSFLVFRKLEQSVEEFWDLLRRKYEDGKIDIKPEELLARLVGRWKSGAPLSEREFEPVTPRFSDHNDFVYISNKEGALAADDCQGHRTPTFAHIRLANPRDANWNTIHSKKKPEEDAQDNARHRILRRGIPYGPPWAKDIETGRRDSRGLLFICYQRDIEQQFHYIQERLASTEDWPNTGGPHSNLIEFQQASGYTKLGLEHWVTTKGGEYFFSPSIKALRGLRSYILEM